jgi:hypothetical protein
MIEVKVKDFCRPETYELFRGIDHEEVVERLVKSKEHANKFIADQAKRHFCRTDCDVLGYSRARHLHGRVDE